MEEKLKTKINKKLLGITGAIAVGVIAGVVANNIRPEEDVPVTDNNYVEDENGNVGNITYTPAGSTDEVIDTTYTETEVMFQEKVISTDDHMNFAKSALGQEATLIESLCENSKIIKDIFENKGVAFTQEKLATKYGDVYSATNIIQGYQIDNTGQYVGLDLRAEYPADSDIPYSISVRINNKVDSDALNMGMISEIGYAFGMYFGDESLADILASNMNSEIEYRGRKYTAVVYTEDYSDGSYSNFKLIDSSYSKESSAEFLLNKIENQQAFHGNTVKLNNIKVGMNNLISDLGESVASIERVQVVSDAVSEELIVEMLTNNNKNIKVCRYTDKTNNNIKYGLDIGITNKEDIDYISIIKNITTEVLGINIKESDIISDGIYKALLEKDGASIYCVDERLVIASTYSKYVYNYSDVYNTFGYTEEAEEIYGYVDYEEFNEGTNFDTSPVEGFEHEPME